MNVAGGVSNGHTRFDCRRSLKKFCLQCSVLTKNCHSPLGNRLPIREAPAHGIRFTPRPHLDIHIRTLVVEILLDTGGLLYKQEYRTQARTNTIFHRRGRSATRRWPDNLAARGHVSLLIVFAGREIWHPFHIMPTLKSTILISVDLWAKLGFVIHPLELLNCRQHSCRVTVVVAEWLAQGGGEMSAAICRHSSELPRFDIVQGPIHLICVKCGVAGTRLIKQQSCRWLSMTKSKTYCTTE